MKEEQCKEQIFRNWREYRCSRKAWKDGYCKQHHPDTVEERRKKAQEKWEKHQENTPIALNRMLNEKTQQCEELAEALSEAALQIEYLQQKFQETGSGNSVLSKIRTVLVKYQGDK